LFLYWSKLQHKVVDAGVEAKIWEKIHGIGKKEAELLQAKSEKSMFTCGMTTAEL